MSDSGGQIGDCEHGNTKQSCVRCLQADVQRLFAENEQFMRQLKNVRAVMAQWDRTIAPKDREDYCGGFFEQSHKRVRSSCESCALAEGVHLKLELAYALALAEMKKAAQ